MSNNTRGVRGGIRRKARMDNEKLMLEWIEDLQTAQRLCNAIIRSFDELKVEWNNTSRKMQVFLARNAKEHRIISEVAQKVAKNHRS